jgi:hypothetical protein
MARGNKELVRINFWLDKKDLFRLKILAAKSKDKEGNNLSKQIRKAIKILLEESH